jgi:hypothetical protein
VFVRWQITLRTGFVIEVSLACGVFGVPSAERNYTSVRCSVEWGG